MLVAASQVPVLRTTVHHILGLSADAPGTFNELNRLASIDPGLAVHVLNRVNATGVAPLSELESVRVAIARLGVHHVDDLMIALASSASFSPTGPAHIALWRHSIAVAVAAQLVVEAHPIHSIPSSTAYTCGLLHDIGRFVLIDEAPRDAAMIEARRWETIDELVAAETGVLGFDHADIGDLVCAQWGLPERIHRVVRDHHRPLRADWADKGDAVTRLIAVIQAADRLTTLDSLHDSWFDLERHARSAFVAEHCFDPRWFGAPIHPDRLADLWERVTGEVDSALRELQLI